jgi:hypothetical protein
MGNQSTFSFLSRWLLPNVDAFAGLGVPVAEIDRQGEA